MKINQFLNSTPFFTLYIAYERILGSFQKALKKEDIHFLQALVLTGIFFETRGVRPSELSQTLGTSPSNMSHALRGLEKKGWIQRETSPDDARAYYFTITKEGKKKAPRLIKLFNSAQDQLEAQPGGKKLNSSLSEFLKLFEEVDLAN